MTENENNEILLTEKEVWDTLTFARSLAGIFQSGIINPDLLNQRLKDISFMPLDATEEDLYQSLRDAKNHEDKLRSFIENFEIISMPFKRILSYMASHLSFDINYYSNAEKEDYNTKSYQRDEKIVSNFLDKFDHKYYFRIATKQMLRNEIYAFCLRENDKIVFQELPLDYVKITSTWDYGFLISFNFYYFLQAGVDINLYHPFFKKKFNELFSGKDIKQYYLPVSPENRGKSFYNLWVDIPPDVAWVFKLDSSLVASVPYFSGLMSEFVNQPVIRTLQKDINFANATKVIMGQVPMLKDTKTSVKDMIAINPKTLGEFLNIAQKSLSNAIKLSSAPLEDMKAFSFDDNNGMYDSWLRTAMASSGMNTSLIFASQQKMNVIDSQLSFESDSKILEQSLYPQFEKFLDYVIGKRTKKFKFNFLLEGNDYFISRKNRMETALNLAEKGIVLPQKIASALGVNPHVLEKWLAESKEKGYNDIVITGGVSSKVGRPQKNELDLSEDGSQTREAGNNLIKGL
ncbi:MAG: hypothetical protein KatS3mg002_1063 [Candidatus Woesearchaeota archaeon]|nr:MAG: hypothetical protein KatS3mg002_1063 [Candidatus Woesearchaeota archaeon]